MNVSKEEPKVLRKEGCEDKSETGNTNLSPEKSGVDDHGG